MEELAERVAEADFGEDDADVLLERWEGRPDYIIEDIFRVRDLVTKEVTHLELTPYQRQFVHAVWFGEESTVSVLKGRRTGYSFIACATILLKAMTLPHSFHAITGPSKSQAKDRLDDIYDLIEWSPLSIPTPIDNRDECELWNGATIMAFAGNPDTSRGADSADILFVDEMAFLDDQKESMRAFSPFVALGDTNTIQISTPNRANDPFMEDVERGSPDGDNGIISIEQPAFENPEDIDIMQSLLEQDVQQVMPYLSLEEAEKDRARDPKGFQQEYLCKPVSDQYRFFTEDGIDRAISRGENDDSYVHHPATHAREGGEMVMGVDIATDGKDDTAIAVFEHVGEYRFLRYHTCVTQNDMNAAGVPGEPENPSDIAQYIASLCETMSVDRVYMDKTGAGKGYWKETVKRIGRKAQGFAFDDKEEIANMMGEFNRSLHKDKMVLVRDEERRIEKQLKAIVKDQTHETSKPKFSGKEHAPNGKDDLAMALVMGAHPPNYDSDKNTSLETRDEAYAHGDEPEEGGVEGAPGFSEPVESAGTASDPHRDDSPDMVDAFLNANSGGARTDRRYNSRHDRRTR